MVEQAQQIPPAQLVGSIPLGRGLMPEELAEFKAKGREWSRLYKEKRRREFSAEQVEERKLKNRLRQKRFRERQKTREQEEASRIASNLHQQQPVDEQHHQVAQAAHSDYDPSQLHYAEHAHAPSEPADEADEAALEGDDQLQHPSETLVEKRKRLGRERQARFREKKRVRSQQQQTGAGTEEGQPGMARVGTTPHPEVMTLTELQKMSAQLSGYYTGLTHGLSQEEHQAVMRFFLDNIREELGDEVFAAPPTYAITDAHAQAQAAAQAHYMVAGQPGIDLSVLQAAAAAHIPQADMQAHLQAHHQAGHLEHPGHLPQQHMQTHLAHHQQMTGNPEASHEELTQAQLDSYHRQLAEHQEQAFEPRDVKEQSQSQSAPQHIPGPEQQGILYAQPGVHQDMLQSNSGMHYVNSNPEQS